MSSKSLDKPVDKLVDQPVEQIVPEKKSLWRVGLRVALIVAGVMVAGVLVWQGITASGVPDPTVAHLDRNAVILNTGILVFREGLEAILVLAAITASLVKANQSYRKPIAAGSGVGFLGTVAKWVNAIGIPPKVDGPGLDIQAATGL